MNLNTANNNPINLTPTDNTTNPLNLNGQTGPFLNLNTPSNDNDATNITLPTNTVGIDPVLLFAPSDVRSGDGTEGGDCPFENEQAGGDSGNVHVVTTTGAATGGAGGSGEGGDLTITLGVGGNGGNGGAAGGSGPFAGATFLGQGGGGSGGDGGPGSVNCDECVLSFIAGSGLGSPGGTATSGSVANDVESGPGGATDFNADGRSRASSTETAPVVEVTSPVITD
ncbi:MAG: hypothetical protein ACT4OM_10075 [Actinomycetota bacterium]